MILAHVDKEGKVLRVAYATCLSYEMEGKQVKPAPEIQTLKIGKSDREYISHIARVGVQ